MSIDIERLKVDESLWPEGATHFDPKDGDWVKQCAPKTIWKYGSKFQSCAIEGEDRDVLGDTRAYIPRPRSEWVDGLPPVGSTQDDCAIRGLSKTDCFEVLAHRDGKAVVYFTASPVAVTTVNPDELRPTPTKAQRDRDELKSIIADHEHYGHDYVTDKIIAAGWTKP